MEEDGEIEEGTPAMSPASDLDKEGGVQAMETSPVITATSSSVPVEAPASTHEATTPAASRPVSAKPNGATNGTAAERGGLGGLAGYVDSDGSDIEMDN